MATGRLAARVAIVTGAAQGLGATYAEALAAEGARVCVADVLDAEPVAAAIRGAGGQAIAAACDVTDPASVRAMVDATVRAFDGVDILVNNAALFAKLALKPLLEIESAEWDRVMAVNVRGPFECVKAVVPVMRRRRYGKIINISSGTVFKGTPLFLHYVTSKGAVVAMTRCLARELGEDGIRVNTLAPGLVMSEGVRESESWTAPIVAANVATRALKREAAPDDVVGTLLYLASAESDFVTGQLIVVDGGSVMH